MIKLIDYKDLNLNQRSAANWSNGPLLVLAGPDSGKTEVLALSIANLLKENPKASVLGLTYTDTAAAEMRERVEQRYGKSTWRVRLQTFNQFAAQTLRQHGSHIGLRSNFLILNSHEDRIMILDRVLQNLPNISDPDFPDDPNNLLRLIDRLFTDSYSGNGKFSILPITPSWIQPLFNGYCETLINTNRVDFRSLVYLVNRLLIKKPAVAHLTQLTWKQIYVDELQNIDQVEYDLLRLISPERNRQVFFVIDDVQLIYRWNGTHIQRLNNLQRDYRLHTLQFPESIRCPPEIIRIANRLTENNEAKRVSEENMEAFQQSCDSTPMVRCLNFASLKEEAKFIGEDIQKRGLLHEDCAVFGRSNKLLHNTVRELCNIGHEAFLFQKKRALDSPLASILLEALRLANLPHNRVVLGRLCRAWYQLTGEMIKVTAVDAQAALVGGNFLRAWLNITNHVTAQKDNCLLQIIQNYLLDHLNFRQIINWLKEDECQSFKNQYMLESTEEEINTWLTLDEEIIAEHGINVPLSTYLREFDITSKPSFPKENVIRCMIIHQARGLQFKHVYLIGMAQEIFPSSRALQSDTNSQKLEEERRNCFASITSAQNTLTLTRSEEYFGSQKQPSQFLKEMQLL